MRLKHSRASALPCIALVDDGLKFAGHLVGDWVFRRDCDLGLLLRIRVDLIEFKFVGFCADQFLFHGDVESLSLIHI